MYTLICIMYALMLFLPSAVLGQPTPVEDKVAVLITDWGMPAGYNFEYAWRAHDAARVGDRTEYIGQPCKIGHVGTFPYEAHMGLVPWGLATEVTGFEIFYDSSGIYKLVDGVYVGIHPDMPSLTPAEIPVGAPIVPVSELVSAMTGELDYPLDPRTGEDYLAGWYKDFYEGIQKAFNERFAKDIIGAFRNLQDPVDGEQLPWLPPRTSGQVQLKNLKKNFSSYHISKAGNMVLNKTAENKYSSLYFQLHQ